MTSTSTLPMGAPRFCDGQTKRHLIGGEWVASPTSFATVNPSTGDVLAEVFQATDAQVDQAVSAARSAFDGPWADFSPAMRQHVLLQIADVITANYDELRQLDVYEMGSPVGAARPALREIVRDLVRYFAGWATKLDGQTIAPSVPGRYLTYTRKEPAGVVGAIIPWNGPMIGTLYKIAPVLATGCTMVLKPSEEGTLSPLRIGELLEQTDLPPGVVNILAGDGRVGAAIVDHPDVDKVSFTGSSVTGQKIVRAASGNLKRVSLELGGKSPNIVFADADLERAVAGAARGIFYNSGQACTAGSRIFVERAVYAEFVERLADAANALVVGHSLDPATQLGPVVSQRQLDRVLGYLESAVDEGARTVAGGFRITDGGLAQGFFVAPTVFADVHDDMRIAREEVFGPVAVVMPFDSVDEIVRRANDTQFGLAAGVWTSDQAKATRIANAIRTGTVWINTYHVMDPATPGGGYKMSGWGREGGSQGIDDFVNIKTIWMDIS